MRYVMARYQSKQRELAYRVYVTDSLQMALGLNRRYYDIITGGASETQNRDAEENEVEQNREAVQRLKDKFKD